MPLPRSVARLNKRFTNRLIEPLVGRLPGFTHIHHQGRVSGNAYKTPLLTFREGDRYLVSLTYGQRADWLKNALVGPASLLIDGQRLPVAHIDVVDLVTVESALPWIVRCWLKILTVREVASIEVEEV